MAVRREESHTVHIKHNLNCVKGVYGPNLEVGKFWYLVASNRGFHVCPRELRVSYCFLLSSGTTGSAGPSASPTCSGTSGPAGNRQRWFLLAREPRLSNKPPVSKTASYSPPRWNPEAAQLFQPLQISGHVPSSMRLTCASFSKQQHCGPTQHKVPTEDPLTLSITTIQPTVGLYTMEIQLWPNFFHLLWSFQLFWDTHLHATVQLISCFTGCILQFFSDGSPSDILWQLISKVGHEFKKYVIWAPLTINYFLAPFFFFLRDCLESKYERMRKSWWIGNLSKQHAVNLMLWINKTPWRGNKGVYVLTAMPCFTEL